MAGDQSLSLNVTREDDWIPSLVKVELHSLPFPPDLKDDDRLVQLLVLVIEEGLRLDLSPVEGPTHEESSE